MTLDEEHAELSRATDEELRQARAELSQIISAWHSRLTRQLCAVQRERVTVRMHSSTTHDERRVAAVKLEELAAGLLALKGGLLVGWAADCALHAARVLREDMSHDAR